MPFLGTLPTLPRDQTLVSAIGQFAQGMQQAKQMRAQSALSDILTQAMAQGGDPTQGIVSGIQQFNASRPTGIMGVLGAFNPMSPGRLPADAAISAMLSRRMQDPDGLSQQYARERLAGQQQENELRGLGLATERTKTPESRRRGAQADRLLELIKAQRSVLGALIPGSNEANEARAELSALMNEYRVAAGIDKPTPAAPVQPAAPAPAAQPVAAQTTNPGLPMLTEEEADRAFGLRVPASQPAAASQPATRPAGKKLDADNPADKPIIDSFLRRAGGDPKKASAMAQAAGYTWDE